MTENIKDTVNQLYALRAGLSTISVNNDIAIDEFDDLEESICDERNKNEKFEFEFSNAEKQLNKSIRKGDFLKREKIAKKDAKSSLFKAIIMWTLLIIVGAIGGVALLAFLGVFFYACAITTDKNFEPGNWVIVSFFVGVVLVPTAYLIYYIKTKLDYETKYYEACCRLAEIRKILKEIEENPEIDKEFQRKKKKLDDSSHDLLALEKKLLLRERYFSDVADNAYKALVNMYSKIIDVRDWENLDLVIFYLETGRAESMKEALQQVDRQRQTDSIVGAIEMASRQICFTIQNGIAHINNTIINSAKILSAQLDGVSSQLSSVNNLLIAQSMQDALTSKADVSSKQLMEDVHQMRIYAENAEIRRRNS